MPASGLTRYTVTWCSASIQLYLQLPSPRIDIAEFKAQGSRSGPEDAGTYAGADEGAGPTPPSLHAAGELIEAHVNRLASARQHLLDEVDRCVPSTASAIPLLSTCTNPHEKSGANRRQGWQASYGLVNLYKDGSECTGSHSGEYESMLTCHSIAAGGVQEASSS